MTDAIPVDIADWSGSSPDQAATWNFAGDGPLGSWDAAQAGAQSAAGVAWHHDGHGDLTAPKAAPHGDAHGKVPVAGCYDGTALTAGIDHAAHSDGILFPIDPSELHHGSAAPPGNHPAETTAPTAAPHGDAHGKVPVAGVDNMTKAATGHGSAVAKGAECAAVAPDGFTASPTNAKAEVVDAGAEPHGRPVPTETVDMEEIKLPNAMNSVERQAEVTISVNALIVLEAISSTLRIEAQHGVEQAVADFTDDARSTLQREYGLGDATTMQSVESALSIARQVSSLAGKAFDATRAIDGLLGPAGNVASVISDYLRQQDAASVSNSMAATDDAARVVVDLLAELELRTSGIEQRLLTQDDLRPLLHDLSPQTAREVERHLGVDRATANYDSYLHTMLALENRLAEALAMARFIEDYSDFDTHFHRSLASTPGTRAHQLFQPYLEHARRERESRAHQMANQHAGEAIGARLRIGRH